MSDTPKIAPNTAAALLIAVTAAAVGFAGGRTTAKQEIQTALVYDASIPVSAALPPPPVVLRQIATTEQVYAGPGGP